MERQGGPLVLRYTSTDTGLKVYWNWDVVGSFIQGQDGESVLVMKDGTAVRLGNGEAAEVAGLLDALVERSEPRSLIDPPTIRVAPQEREIDRRVYPLFQLVDAVCDELNNRRGLKINQLDEDTQRDIKRALADRFLAIFKEGA